MFWMPPALVEALRSGQGQATASGTTHDSGDPAWAAWQATMGQYQQATTSGSLPKLTFWFVIALPGNSYSEQLEWHDDIPMLMPASGTGTLLGLAQTKDELDEMLHKDRANVHLTYKVKIQGQEAWRDLLGFLAEHDMIERET